MNFSNASLSTDGPSNQRNIQLSSHRHQLQKSGATHLLGRPIVINESTLVRTSFKNGKMTNVEAASQNRRRRRMDIWARGRGVYFVDDLLPPTVEDMRDSGSSCRWSWYLSIDTPSQVFMHRSQGVLFSWKSTGAPKRKCWRNGDAWSVLEMDQWQFVGFPSIGDT